MAAISIIIPTFNRSILLEETLGAIATAAPRSHPVEIVVIDNGSTDATPGVVQNVKKQYPQIRCHYVIEPMPGLLSGRHRGAYEAEGEILAYLDDDALLSSTWFEALQEAFGDPNVTLVGGPSLPRYESRPPKWLECFWCEDDNGRMLTALSLIDLGGTVKKVDARLVWGLNFCIRKRALFDLGGFHPDLVPPALQRYQGDGETGLSDKINAAGLTSLYHPGVAVTHIIPPSRLTPEAFRRRGFYQGVCDSFTEIRRNGFANPEPARSWRSAFGSIKRKLRRPTPVPKQDDDVMQLVNRAYYAGRQFHRSEVIKDPALLEWVTRSDYLDYALPRGWQSYAAGDPHR